MAGFFNYDPKQSDLANAVQGYRVCSGIVVGLLFAICTILLISYKINKRMTIEMSDELALRRRNPATA
jgi:GPH family glycoside/pentoside/hexuronide:cation symporter